MKSFEWKKIEEVLVYGAGLRTGGVVAYRVGLLEAVKVGPGQGTILSLQALLGPQVCPHFPLAGGCGLVTSRMSVPQAV